jgi:hypothetical protein
VEIVRRIGRWFDHSPKDLLIGKPDTSPCFLLLLRRMYCLVFKHVESLFIIQLFIRTAHDAGMLSRQMIGHCRGLENEDEI